MFNGVADARGEKVAANICPADAALIVDAVNERDRLRDQLAAALRLSDECSRDAAAVHAGRARAVEEAQSEANRRADRLRDIVRRLLPLAETTVENIRALGAARFPFEEHIKSDRLRADINREVSNAEFLLREARAAIGEDAQ